MLPLGKLIGIVALQRSLSDTTLFQQFLVGAGTFILLTVVTAFMVGAVLVGGLFIVHAGLIGYGLSYEAANIAVAAFALLITLLLMFSVNNQLQKLQGMLHRLIRAQSPIPAKIADTAEAFIHGLTGGLRSRKL